MDYIPISYARAIEKPLLPSSLYADGMTWEFVYHTFLVGGIVCEIIYVGRALLS